MNFKTEKSTGQNERTSTQVFAVLVTIALSALLASGCSTPGVSGNSVDQPSTTSYANCMRVMTSQGVTTYQCDTVSTYNTASYARYTTTKTAPASKVSAGEMQQAYATYLSSLSPEALAEMNAQWDALSATH